MGSSEIVQQIRSFSNLTLFLGSDRKTFKVEPTPTGRLLLLKLDPMSAISRSPVFVKALPLQQLDDVETIKAEIRTGNILIIRITPLARKSVDETKLAITELTDHVKSTGGDIARLGEERIVITPPGVKIWRRESGSTEAPIEAAPPAQKEGLRGNS